LLVPAPASPAGRSTIVVTGGGAGSRVSGRTAFVIPVAFRSPVGVRRFAHGSTSRVSGRAAAAGSTPAANADSRASSYSSYASVRAHQTRRSSVLRSAWSQWPDEDGRRSPSTVRAIAATRAATEPAVLPMNSTGSPGSQNAARRACNARELGR